TGTQASRLPTMRGADNRLLRAHVSVGERDSFKHTLAAANFSLWKLGRENMRVTFRAFWLVAIAALSKMTTLCLQQARSDGVPTFPLGCGPLAADAASGECAGSRSSD